MTTDRQRVRSSGATRICRAIASALSDCSKSVGEVTIAPSRNSNGKKQTATFTDVLAAGLESERVSDFATYAVEIQNADGRSAGLSNQVRVSLARTLAPPADFRASVSGQGVVLSWKGGAVPQTSEGVQYVYRVYRRLDGTSEWMMSGEAKAAGEGDFTFTDSSIEWEKTYDYRAETVTLLAPEGSVSGADTPEIKVFAHDVFPPAVPSGLQAVYSGPGQHAFVDLIWSPVPDGDVDGYNVYRHEEGGCAVKVNAAPVKAPAYRDNDVAHDKHYFYSVSSVDVRGNESARSEGAEESVP